MIIGHGGNIYALARKLGCSPDDITDMSSNVNPCGTMPGLKSRLGQRLGVIEALPEADAGTVTGRLADCYGVGKENVAPGNGSTQLLYALPRALDIRRALIVGPTYADYASACRQQDIEPDWLLGEEENAFRTDTERLASLAGQYDTVFICNPNNPTGDLMPAADLAGIFTACPNTFFVVDESYLPFARESEQSLQEAYASLPNVIRMTSMSKIFRIPGLRIGFAIARADLITRLRQFAMPWSVNSLACEAVTWILQNRARADQFIRETRTFLSREREKIIANFEDNPGIQWYPSCTSFLLARLTGARQAADVCTALAGRRILIRNCANFEGLFDNYIRVSLKGSAENQRFCRVLTETLEAS